VLGVAPDDLDQRVRTVLDSLMLERGFLRYSSHVAQVGRVRFIEIHISFQPTFALKLLGRWMTSAGKLPPSWRLHGRKLGLPWT